MIGNKKFSAYFFKILLTLIFLAKGINKKEQGYPISLIYFMISYILETTSTFLATFLPGMEFKTETEIESLVHLVVQPTTKKTTSTMKTTALTTTKGSAPKISVVDSLYNQIDSKAVVDRSFPFKFNFPNEFYNSFDPHTISEMVLITMPPFIESPYGTYRVFYLDGAVLFVPFFTELQGMGGL